MDIRRLFPFALFALLAGTAIRPIRDPDVWWHLRTGELIELAGIPRTDPYSFTVRGSEWVAHEWLSELLMWKVFELGGFVMLSVLFSAVIVVTWLLVYRVSDGGAYVAGLVVAVASTASEVVWGPRPQLFNLLLLAVLLHLLERRKQGTVGVWIFGAIPLVLLMWANLHSGFLLGVVALGAYWVGEFAQRWLREPTSRTLAREDIGWLGVALVAASGLTFLNPQGPRLWAYPFETLTSATQRQYIAEWFPPQPDQLAFWLVIALVAVTLVSMIISPESPDVTDVLLLVGTSMGAFLSLRNVAIFAVAVAPITCRYLTKVLRPRLALLRHETVSGRLSLPTVGAAVLIAVSAGGIAYSAVSRNETQIGEKFPVAAVDWLADSDLSGERLFNSYNFGGYLIWRGVDVFIDGRADVYGDTHLNQYATTYFVEEGWEQPLDEYGIGLVLIEPESSLADALAQSEGWTVVYRDDTSVVFRRR